MKKVLITFLLLAVAGGLFAQLTVGGSVDMIWVPFQAVNDGDDMMMGAALGRDAPGEGIRTQLTFAGQNEDNTVGFQVQPRFWPYNSALGFGDNAKLWWQPIPQVRLVVGKYVESQLIGNEWDFWFRRFTVGSYNAAVHVFHRFDGNGALLVLTPGDLTIGFNFPYGGTPFNNEQNSMYYETTIWPGGSQQSIAPNFGTGAQEFMRAYQKTQIAVGYKIPDIGLARFQFVGANPNVAADWDDLESIPYTSAINAMRLEAAFRLQAVEGLDLDIGFKYPLPFNESAVKGWNAKDKKWDSDYAIPAKDRKAPGYKWDKDTESWVLDPGTTTGTPASAIPDGTYQAPMTLGVGIIYKTGAFRVDGIITSNFGGKFDIKDEAVIKMGPDLNIHFWPTYNLGPVSSLGNVTLGVDLGFWWKGTQKIEPAMAGAPTIEIKNGIMVGGGVFGTFAYAGGSVNIGLALSVPTKIGETPDPTAADPDNMKDLKSPMVFSIPIMFSYSF